MDDRKADILIRLAGRALIEKNLKTEPDEDMPEVKVPKSLDRRIRRMIRHERREPYNAFLVAAKRAAVACLAVCSIIFAMAMGTKAGREALWTAIVEWYEKYIAVAYRVETEAPSVIEEYHEPWLVPVGSRKEVRLKNDNMYVIEYYDDNELILHYTQALLDDVLFHHDNKNCKVTDILVSNFEGMLFQYDNKSILIWNDGKYRYELTSYGNTEQQIIAIAESVQKTGGKTLVFSFQTISFEKI